MRVVFKSHWHPNSNGTEYTDVLGIYDNLQEAERNAIEAAIDRYEWPSEEEEDGLACEGPDVVVEEYVEGEDGHDNERAGGGSFAEEFERLEFYND